MSYVTVVVIGGDEGGCIFSCRKNGARCQKGAAVQRTEAVRSALSDPLTRLVHDQFFVEFSSVEINRKVIKPT